MNLCPCLKTRPIGLSAKWFAKCIYVNKGFVTKNKKQKKKCKSSLGRRTVRIQNGKLVHIVTFEDNNGKRM